MPETPPVVPNIAIGIPYYGDVRAQFAISLANLTIAALRAGVPVNGKSVVPGLGVFWGTGSVIADNRQKISESALEAGATHLLFLDTDHRFPSSALARLMVHMAKTKVAGCNYPRRGEPTGPTALNVKNGSAFPVYTTPEKAEKRIVEGVDYLGLGVCLIEASVFGLIEKPWFAADYERGEDGYFFNKLAAVGVKPFVDHNLSWEVGHIAERVLTNADAIADQSRWSLPA